MENERHDTHNITCSSSEEYYNDKENSKNNISSMNDENNGEEMYDAPENTFDIKNLFNTVMERNEKNKLDHSNSNSDNEDKKS